MDTQDNIRLNTDKNICDGFGCSREAITTIEEEDGDGGIIRLELCDDCLSNFINGNCKAN